MPILKNPPVIFVRHLTVPGLVGVFDEEKKGPQNIRISFRLTLSDGLRFDQDELHSTVCYKELSEKIQCIVETKHTHLVEKLTEEIAYLCMQDQRVQKAWVKIEKFYLSTMPLAESVGSEIELYRS